VRPRWPSLGERFPAQGGAGTEADGSLYLGPLPSTQHATAVVEAIQTVAPLRRCPRRSDRGPPCRRADPCLPAQLGGPVPVRGAGEAEAYRRVVQTVVEG
jgi:excinuclease UvrABC nuclease subunit